MPQYKASIWFASQSEKWEHNRPKTTSDHSLSPRIISRGATRLYFWQPRYRVVIIYSSTIQWRLCRIILQVQLDYPKNSKVIITGQRNANGVWSIPLATLRPPILKLTPLSQENRTIKLDQTRQELAQYLSGVCFSLDPSTLMQSIRRKHMFTWPGLTTFLISKHLPKIIVTAKKHLYQIAKILQSTSSHQDNIVDEDIAQKQENDNKYAQDIICTIFDSKTLESKSYFDQTGCFPIRSSRGSL